MVLADRARQHHADDIGWKHRLAVRPSGERSQSEQTKEQVFRLEFRGPIAVAAEEAPGEPRQQRESANAGRDENRRLHRERREDEAERDHRPEVGDETGGEHGFPVFGRVEAELQHDGVNHGDRGGRHRDTGEPARHHLPAEHVMRARRAAEKRKKEAREPDRRRLLPLEAEHHGIELRAGQEREHDRADAGEEFHPAFVGSEHGRPNDRSQDQLREGPHHDLGQRCRDAQPDRKQAGDHGETQPQRRKCPHACHAHPSPLAAWSCEPGGNKKPARGG